MSLFDRWADEFVILAAGLRSSAASAAGISFGALQSSPGAVTYSEAGADFDASTKALQFELDTHAPNDYKRLAWGGRLRFTVPIEALDVANTLGATKYFLSKAQGWFQKHSSGYLVPTFPESSGLAPSAPRFYCATTLKAARVEVIIAWNEAAVWLFVDGLPVGARFPAELVKSAPVSEFVDLYVGGLTGTAGSYPAGYPVSDLVLSTEPYYYAPSLDYGRVLFIGDSLTTQGALPASEMGAYGVVPWNPGAGFDAEGSPNAGGAFAGDAGYIPEFFRTLAKGGILCARGSNQAKSGANASATATNIAAWFAGGGAADVACVIIGTNDVAQGTSAASYQASLETLIDECVAAGVKKIVLGTVPTLRSDPTYRTSAKDALTLTLNAVIAAMPAYHAACSVVDLFTHFGRFNFDPADFTDNVHPNAVGSTRLGRWMGAGVLAAVNGARRAVVTDRASAAGRAA